MSHLLWLDQERVSRIKQLLPKPRGFAGSDDRTVLSGIIHVIRNGLPWRDAPAEYGPHQALNVRPPLPNSLLEKHLISGPETGG